MKQDRIQISLALLFVLFTGSLFGQSNDTLRTYIFGHSLINHELQVNPTPSQETSVPHWFQALAQEENEGYAVSGQYGFIGGHARNLPPIAQWGFDSVPAAWNDNYEPFSAADFDNILITPANFIQWQPPTADYYNDSISPIEATNMVFNWADQQEDSLIFYVYENWPDMGPYLSNGFPPTQSEWNAYNQYLNGDFHDWFLEYHDSLMLAHPNSCVRMIPTGPIISGLLSQSPFNQIAIDTLYEDDAPHGRPTIYFLAALCTYMAMYERPAPVTYQVPPIIDPIVANNYTAAIVYIWNELQAFTDSNGQNRVFCNSQVLAIEENEPGQQEPGLPEVEEDWMLYPNPTTGLLSIRGDFETMKVEVMDIQGRFLPVPRVNAQTLDMSNLAEGLYLVKLTDPTTGQTQVTRILKQ